MSGLLCVCSATSFGVESSGPKVSGGGVHASLTARLPGFEPFGFGVLATFILARKLMGKFQVC